MDPCCTVSINPSGKCERTYKIAALKMAIGTPRSLTSQISEMVPPTFVIGADEAIPAIFDQLILHNIFLKRRRQYLPIGRLAWYRY
jgi:hypothetical protein